MTFPTYHSHTRYCDGQGSPEDFLRAAIDLGLFAYGFSSHSPLPFPNEWSMRTHDIDEYIEEINTLRSEYSEIIEVYLGLEADYIPEKSLPLEIKQKYNLDYVIGSIHYVKSFNSGVPWQIDGPPDEFERGYMEIFNRQAQALVSEYYSLTRRMVEESRPDIIGHMDKIKMHNGSFRLFSEDDQWYQNEVKHTLEVARDAGCIIEVNTRGMYRKGLKEPYPSTWILRQMKDMQIPVMLNSDAHQPSEITGEYDKALEILKSVGIRELTVLRNGNLEVVSSQ